MQLEDITSSDRLAREYTATMFKHQLFGRVWIIQELGLASNVKVLSGDLEIEWYELIEFIMCLQTKADIPEMHFKNRLIPALRTYLQYIFPHGDKNIKRPRNS